MRLKEIAENGKKKAIFKQERVFGRSATIPIALAFIELAEMDFVDRGDYAAFLHTQGAFSRFSAIVFPGTKKKEEQPGEIESEGKLDFRLGRYFRYRES